MKKAFIPILWLISGVILIFTGILAFFHSLDMEVVAYIMGIATLIYAVLNCIISYKGESNKRWVLNDGLQTLLIAIILLCTRFIAPGAVPVVVAMWVINTGISRCFLSADLKREKQNGWYWITFLSLLAVFFGFISLLSSIGQAFSPQTLTGILMITQGITSVCLWLCTSRWAALTKQPK